MPTRSVPTVLTIAGSDSGGGAGIQADLKAFAACGVHGMSAITALTAQSTTRVSGVHAVPPEFVVEQVRTIAADLPVDAVKTGMLASAEVVDAVVEALGLLPDGTPLVVDPVMVAESGATLLDDGARRAVVERLLPRATVVTPNLPEARELAAVAGMDVPDEVEDLARALRGLGPQMVVITGGHREEATDVVFDGTRMDRIPGPRHPDGAAHGSGCTHASALAAFLALGYTPRDAAIRAKHVAAAAVREGLRDLGAGPGPVDVFALARRGRVGPPVPEAEFEDTQAGRRLRTAGWFVLNLADAAGFGDDEHGVATDFEVEPGFRDFGVNVHVLQPGQTSCQYHAESSQEDFLVLAGTPLVVIEEQERTLREGDLVHCPGGTRHVFVGAGDGPSAILMIGTRGLGDGLLYPVSEVAARHGASSRFTTTWGREAYEGWPHGAPRRFPWPL